MRLFFQKTVSNKITARLKNKTNINESTRRAPYFAGGECVDTVEAALAMLSHDDAEEARRVWLAPFTALFCSQNTD
jgi:hypothetical protein